MLRDHPRIRGEHLPARWHPQPSRGSSPHTRGALVGRGLAGLPDGIIPAYAGSTRRPWPCSASCRDHPRIRGEHSSRTPSSSGSRGSSPHTRGAPLIVQDRTTSRGIIPAYAGSTSEYAEPITSVWDHPRIRGEHPIACTSWRSTAGSSPHTRGALLPSTSHHRDRGIIPAYAGSTASDTQGTRLFRDHPRIRGEHLSSAFPISKINGSSPHTRGARTTFILRAFRAGIIPAYAGSTSTSTTG